MKKFLEKIKEKGYLFATWFGISNPWGSSSFSTLEGTVAKVTQVMNWAVAVSALVAVGAIIYGAYNIIIAAGDPDKYETGMNTIQAAIVGMVIVFLAKTIILFLVENGIVGIAGIMYV